MVRRRQLCNRIIIASELLGYNGKRFDPAVALYDYGRRDYSPMLGRWITLDPAKHGNNWYSYVYNDPVNFFDPTGLVPGYYTESEREIAIEYISGLKPSDIPDEYDCADTALYIYRESEKKSTGRLEGYGKITKKVPGSWRNILASDLFGEDNRNIKYYEAGSSKQSYHPSEIDRSFKSPNIEVGTVGAYKRKEGYKPKPGEAECTGHPITVQVVEKDTSGDTIKLTVIEGQLGYPQRIRDIESEKDLYDFYPGLEFVGWGEWEPSKKNR